MLLNSPIEPPGALSVEAFARWASIDQASVLEEIYSGSLDAFLFKDRILISYPAAELWLSSLPAAFPGES